MPSLGARLVLAINRLFPPLAIHRELAAAKAGEAAYAAWEMTEGRQILPDFGLQFSLAGKAVLDVGSGLGGKPALYSLLGAATVTGIDLRPRSALAARRFAEECGARPESARFVVGDAAHLPFRRGAFDLVISVNVFEHVEEPERVLAECLRVAAGTGQVCLRFPPWYSPWAPHLDGWINWPWPHLFFREETLIEAANTIEERRPINADLIPSGVLDLRGRKTLPELNHVTIRRFKAMLRATGARVLVLRLVPPGSHGLAQRGLAGTVLLAILARLATTPGLAEVVTTKIVCVLEGQGDRTVD